MPGTNTHAVVSPVGTFTLEDVRGSTVLEASAIGAGSLLEVRAEIDDESESIDLIISRSAIEEGRAPTQSAAITVRAGDLHALAGLLGAIAPKVEAVLA